ncbi:MAG: hypothetical protein IPM01_27970 [Burkholderiaceae bacterium]|nr:hypothetical protein [Burkholderiaceae bacterium]
MSTPSIPPSKAAPFDPFTRTLYTPEELYTGFDPNDSSTFETYFDRLIYLSYMDQKSKTPIPTPADLLLLRRLHDATVAEALDDFAGSKSERIVAIMGSHDRGRDEAIYRDVAYLSLHLTQQG